MVHSFSPTPPIFLVVVVVVVSGALADTPHECVRECVKGEHRVCHYDFNVQEYHTMSRACYSCPDNLDDCSREDCISVDGAVVPVLSVNRKLPGPEIQVCKWDRIVVDLHNNQHSDTETIHFHGMAMVNYQYNDGMPFVTQCPVLAGTFRYDFIAMSAGTHLWHSHAGLHRGQGVFGALVIRWAEDHLLHLYDTDLPEHVVVLHGFDHTNIETSFWGSHHAGVFAFPKNVLINGKGRDPATQQEDLKPLLSLCINEQIKMPLEVFRVTPGLRHRIRFINGGSFDCPLLVSIDGHRFTLINMDGGSLVPIVADSFVMFSGERLDIILEANQTVGNYWIRVNGLDMCSVAQARQGAILRYEGAPEEEPKGDVPYQPDPKGVTVNPLLLDPEAPNLVSLATLEGLEPSNLDNKVDKKFYLAFNFRAVNSSLFYNPELYPYNRVAPKFKDPTPQVNNITFAYPDAPPLSQPDAIQTKMCMYGEEPQCEGDFCSCAYVLEVNLNDMVELILIDEGDFFNSSHPFHLHGYDFHVMAMESLGDTTSLAEVRAMDEAGHIKRRMTNTIKKDTINIPHGGYLIVRFIAYNPGWWALHCHLMDHSEMGMFGILHVGTQDDLPPVPPGFPKCGSFLPDIEQGGGAPIDRVDY